jgi:hypothetical protein
LGQSTSAAIWLMAGGMSGSANASNIAFDVCIWSAGPTGVRA